MDDLILTKLFETQKILDDRIVKEKGLEGQDLLDKKILALQVELGELANEVRSWKFWSNDQEPRTKVLKFPTMNTEDKVYENRVLNEYVDCLHFILSIGLDIKANHIDFYKVNIEHEKYGLTYQEENLTQQFNSVFFYITTFENLRGTDDYIEIMLSLINLGKMLGFIWEQIEQAYYQKNQINHARQSEGY